MKKLVQSLFLSLFLSLGLVVSAHAQAAMPVVKLPENLTIHFISPEPIQYVDISSKLLVGDLPLKNVLRIRQRDSSAVFEDAVITIAGEKFIAQYRLLPGDSNSPAEVNILFSDTKPLDISGIGFSSNQLRNLSLRLISQGTGKWLEKTKAFGITGQLNNMYSLDDYIFLDVSYRNKNRLRYDLDEFRFKIDDKKVTKASNIQSLEISPVFILSHSPSFEKYYRNIFVFKKMSFPGNKVLHIDLSEKQISGRVITLSISYKDVLNADTLPN